MSRRYLMAAFSVTLVAVCLAVHSLGQNNNPGLSTNVFAKYQAVKQITEFEWRVMEFNSQWSFHRKPFDYVEFGPLVAGPKDIAPLRAYAVIKNEPITGSQLFTSLDRPTQQAKIMAASALFMAWVGAVFPEIHEHPEVITVSLVRHIDKQPIEIGRIEGGVISLTFD